MMSRLFDKLYYWTALAMPLWWQWQWQFVANARVYFEMKHDRITAEHNQFPEPRT